MKHLNKSMYITWLCWPSYKKGSTSFLEVIEIYIDKVPGFGMSVTKLK